MTDMSGVAKEVFQILLRFDYTVKLYDENGMDVVEPSDARRMFAQSPNILISLVDDDDNSNIKLLFGKSTHANDINGLMQALRTCAAKYNMTFEPKQYGKEIDAKEYKNLQSVSESLKESNMRLCKGMYGTSRSSYLQLDNAKMMIQHNGRIDPSRQDARAQKIGAIFIENASGHRFAFPLADVAAARALTEHVSAGGRFDDRKAKRLIEAAREKVAADIRRAAPKPVNASTLAENNSVIREFMEWTASFAPHRALMEFNDQPDLGDMGDDSGTDAAAPGDFDVQGFLSSEQAKAVVPDGDGGEVSKRDLMSALDEYLRQQEDRSGLDSSTDDLDDHDGAIQSQADAVFDQVSTALADEGFTIHDDVDEQGIEDTSGAQPLNDCTITREDVLLPNRDQGAGLSREVGKAVVHADPAHPGEETSPDGNYISRLKTLSGMRSGRPY